MKKNIFSIPLHEFYGEDASINAKLIPLIYTHLEKIRNTLSSTDKNKFDCSENGLTSFYGPNLLQLQEFNFFHDYLYKNLEKEYQRPVSIQNMWFTVYKENHFIPRHTHPISQWSGVYYVQAYNNCGNLNFYDPIGEFKNHFGNDYKAFVEIEPKENLFLTFPSWLAHQSNKNKSNYDRIIVSYNFFVGL